MARTRILCVAAFFLMAVIALACSPSVAPIGAPAPSPPPAPPGVTPTPAVARSAAEDDAWSRVVAAAKKEGRVNVYSFNMTGDIGLAVSRGFQEKFGVRVDIVTGGGAALSERIITEKRAGAMVADMMDTNVLQISNIKDAGATLSSQEIPALRESGVWLVEPWANDPQRHILMHTLAYHAGVINTKMVKSSEEPRSLKDLASPS